MAGNNILDLEPQKIQKLSGGIQAPKVKVANEDISESVNNLTSTIMEIGGSIMKNNRAKEKQARIGLEQQEKKNLEDYNKIFKIQASEMTNGNYAKLKVESESFYENPSAFLSTMRSAYDTSYKSISDNKGLTEPVKAELYAQLDKSDRTLKADFRLRVNEFNTKRNQDEVEGIVNTLGANAVNYAYEGNAEASIESLVAIREAYKLGLEIGSFTEEEVKQNIGVLSSQYLEGHIVGLMEQSKKNYDLETTEGQNGYIAELEDLAKNFDAKQQRNFFNKVFKGLPFEQKDVGTKVHKMIKEQIGQQLYIAKKKKVGLAETTLKETQQLQLDEQLVLQRQGIIYSGKESNRGQRAQVVGAKLDRDFPSDLEAGIVAEKSNTRYSLYSKEEAKILEQSISMRQKVNDVEGVMEILNEAYDFKLLDEDGLIAFDYDEDMFYLDIIDITGGKIDGNYFKAYRNDDQLILEDYRKALRFGSQNDMVGIDKGDLTLNDIGGMTFLNTLFTSPLEVGKVLMGDTPFRVMNDKMTFMSINREDVEEPNRLRGLINDWAYSYFYENTLADEDAIAKYNKEDEEGKQKMIEKFYSRRDNIDALGKASERFSENFLSGTMININVSKKQSKILVSEKYKELDFNAIVNNVVQYGHLIYLNPENGEPYQISPFKLRENLIVETTGEDEIGFFYKDRQHPLKFSEGGVLKDAGAHLSKFTELGNSITSDEQVDVKITKHKADVQEFGKKLSKAIMNIRNVRNNNAGNLKEVGIKWQGKLKETDSGGTTASGSFTKFKTPQHGVRALNKDLTTKINRGLNTITQILNVYAPSGTENDTQAYIQAVSNSTGIDPNQPLTKADMFGLVKAIISHEGGRESLLYYTDKVIETGMKMK